MKKMNKKGFTLVEIMIVVAIIGLLAAIAIPSFAKSRQSSRTKACINNLRMIEAAKEQWAMENNKVDTDTVSAITDLDDWIKGGCAAATNCPASGTVTVEAIGTAAACTATDHELPN